MTTVKNSDLYDPQFVSGMFDRMSKTYGLANLITSFWFSARWRKQCIADLPKIEANSEGYDLMSGMGESWSEVQKRLDGTGRITAVDISKEMNRKALMHLSRLKHKNVTLSESNILKNKIPSESADFIVSTFGIKTFNESQQIIFAKEISRILKKGGAFAFIEISEPQSQPLKTFYMFYLKAIIPLIGKLFLGNASDYRMLGVYCEKFKNSHLLHEYLLTNGLKSTYKSYFFGCATGVFGTK